MPFHHFPAHFVYWTQIPEHKEIRDVYLPKIDKLQKVIKDNKPFEACKLGTSFSHEDNKVNDFLYEPTLVENLVMKPITNMLNEIQSTNGMKNINIDELKITTAWFNTYHTQEFQELHDHNGYPEDDFHPCFSLVYILNNPNISNDTVYRLKQQPFLPHHAMYQFDTSNVKSIHEGTLIVSSSSLPHLVKPSTNPGRVTIAYNVYAKFPGA